MHIVILNGSPKGQRSVTLRYSSYVDRRLPGHTYEIHDVAKRIRKLDRDADSFEDVIEAVRRADLVLWSFPLYVLLVSAQYKRFIELVFEREAMDAFKGRPAALLSTSIKFFDCTAHDYMRSICDDLEMRFMGAYSADMHDLLDADERERIVTFFEQLFDDVNHGRSGKTKLAVPLPSSRSVYSRSSKPEKVRSGAQRIVLVVDRIEPGSNLATMIDRVRATYEETPEMIVLEEANIRSGCLGCCRCGLNNECRWEGKDDFIALYREKVMTADVVIFAGTVRDRFLSSQWKVYFDRAFFNTHTPALRGKQLGVLLSGPLRQLPHLRQFFEGYAEWQGANLVDIVTDEPSSSAEIDHAIDGLTMRLARYAETCYVRPATFLGVGGWKIFRDDIWGRLRFVFRADHRAFKQLGAYDFPQKDVGARARNMIMHAVTTVPASRRDYLKNITRHMVAPFQKILDEAVPTAVYRHGRVSDSDGRAA